jgi:hypothetical protein
MMARICPMLHKKRIQTLFRIRIRIGSSVTRLLWDSDPNSEELKLGEIERENEGINRAFNRKVYLIQYKAAYLRKCR